MQNNSALEGAAVPRPPVTELLALQTGPDPESTIQRTPSQATNEGGRTSKPRVWIKDESPEREDSPTENGPPLHRKTSLIGRVSVKVRGRVRNPNRNRDDGDRDREGDSSLLDMASFLKSTGPDTPRTSSGDDGAGQFIGSNKSRPKYKARDPIVRSDTADLINFFREGSPRVKKSGTGIAPQNIPLVRHATDPITPPPSGREDTDMASSPISPTQSHLRSQSAGMLSPLGSHPPEPQIDPSRPATTRWPLQAVLAWLEKSSFSAEWQATFRALQIQGSDFVELESGQSIRKMLTVIYPQLAKECAKSGTAWDQARERAEGQRLRKLIRELPVDIKYEDGSVDLSEEKEATADEPRPAIRSSARLIDISAGGRRRAVTAPVEDTTPRTPQIPTETQTQTQTQTHTPARNEFERTEISSLDELEEEEQHHQVQQQAKPDVATAAAPPHRPEMPTHPPPPPPQAPAPAPAPVPVEPASPDTTHVPDEWVRRWTVLSPEEISRGRNLASRGSGGGEDGLWTIE
jgi:hypothetical protein